MANEEEYLKRHLVDLSFQSVNRMMYTFSGFLSLPEQDVFQKSRKEFAVKAALYGGAETAERKIAVFGSEEELGYEPPYPVVVLQVDPVSEKYAEELNHRDYLGAILGLGIERSLIGDIIVKEKKAWFYCLLSISDYLMENLMEIRHTRVNLHKVSSDLPELQPVFQELQLNVASERLDAVVAAFCNLSRGRAAELFPKERVMVNGKVCTSMAGKMKEGDVFSVRGFGKAVYLGISHETRKGRYYVTIKKYA